MTGSTPWVQPSPNTGQRITATPGMRVGDRYELVTQLASWPQPGAADPLVITSWQATDVALSRPVLMQLMDPADPRTANVLAAARRAAATNDPRFLRVLDAMEASGQEPFSFIVGESPTGQSLQEILPDGPLRDLEAAWLLQQLAEALAPMHERGNFHLCLQPSAVVVTSDGNLKLSGMLIDAAIQDVALTRSPLAEQQAADLKALGELLYACLTGYWPVDPSLPQHVTHALAPAPLAGMPGEQSWMAPRNLRTEVHPGLDRLAMQLLTSPQQTHTGKELGSVADVAAVLTKIMGGADATEALEMRMRMRRGESVAQPHPDELPTDFDASTQTMVAVPDNEPTAAVPRQIAAEPGEAEPTDSQPLPRVKPVRPAPSQAQLDRQAQLRRRRTLFGVVGFILAALLALQLKSCASRGSSPDTKTSISASAPSTPVAAQIADAFDFDPKADGGDQDENKSQVPLMHDGDPKTVWHTLTYFNNPSFGGLKPGAGVVIDLGSAKAVTSVHLLLDNQPNVVQLMIPAADPAGANAPSDTVKSWQVVAKSDAAPAEADLRPDTAVTTRWVLIYFTKLPPIAPARFRTGIFEATVFTNP